MTPRRALAADVPAIEAIVEAAYRGYVERIGVEPLPMVDDYDRRVADGDTWVVGEPAVAVLVLVEADGYLLLDNVAVAPDRQGEGIGRSLIGFAEDEARRRGFPELRLYTNEKMTENRALYASLGWRETGRESLHGRHAVWMAKAVGAAPSHRAPRP